MARKLSDQAIAYVKIQALDRDNRPSAAAIHRALVAGQVDELGPIEVSLRRVQQLVSDFQREDNQAIDQIDPASLPEATNTERALLIAEARRRRKIAAAMPDTSTKALDLMTKCARFLDAIDRNYNGKTVKDQTKARAGAEPEHRSTLDMLGESLGQPASERPTTHSPTSNGHPDSARDTAHEADTGDEAHEDQPIEQAVSV